MTGNIGVLGGCAEGVGKGWHAESVAYPYDEYANVWWASLKSDRWAHCVLNYPNVKREEIGCWPRDDELDGMYHALFAETLRLMAADPTRIKRIAFGISIATAALVAVAWSSQAALGL